MDAEIEVLSGELIEPEAEPTGRLARRARDVVANPRVQGAAAATAGMIVGATTLALMRRAGRSGGAALRRAATSDLAPAPGVGAARPPIGPIQPGTYIVRITPIGPPPAVQRQAQ